MRRDTSTETTLLSLVVPGTVLAGKFQIVRKLGRGGMGIVFEAHHMELDERVALKFLQQKASDETTQLQRFYREARAAAKIKSEHVTRVLDVGKLDTGEPYMVMEHLEGIDLSRHLKTHGKLPITLAVDYIIQAADAVAEGHAIGIIHRDLKPSNLFLAERLDGTRIVKVLDFGIAKQEDGETSGLTDTSLVFGSMVYMSPEQQKSTRDVDPRTDVYSLGVTLFELIAGRAPFYAKLVPEIMMQKAQGKGTPLRELRPDASAELEGVIERAFERDLERRYDSMATFARALAPFASEDSKHLLARIGRLKENTSRSLPRATIIPELRQFAKEIELELELAGDPAPAVDRLSAPEWSDEWSDEYSLKQQKSTHARPIELALPKLAGSPGVSRTDPASAGALGGRAPLTGGVPLPLIGGAALGGRPPLVGGAPLIVPASVKGISPASPDPLAAPDPMTIAELQQGESAPGLPSAQRLAAEGPASRKVESRRSSASVRPPRKKKRAAGLALAGLLVVGGGLGAFFMGRASERAGTSEELVSTGIDKLAQGVASAVAAQGSAAPSVVPVALTAASAEPSVAGVAPPSPSPSPSEGSMLRHFCAPGTKASAACSNGLAAWCDKDEAWIACCDVGLVATGKGSACGCPEGGPLMPKAIAAGCSLSPDVKLITPNTINDLFIGKRDEFQACYRSVPLDPRRPVALLVLGLELSPDGQVYAARVQSSSVPNAAAEECALGAARAIRFPPPSARGMRFIHPLSIVVGK